MLADAPVGKLEERICGQAGLIRKIQTFSVFSLKLTLRNFLTYSTGEQTLLNTFPFGISKYKGHFISFLGNGIKKM